MANSVSGTVSDYAGNALAGVTVIAQNSTVTSRQTTNKQGFFSFSLQNGDYTVTASLSGYNDSSWSVTVTDSLSTDLDMILLKPGGGSTEEQAGGTTKSGVHF